MHFCNLPNVFCWDLQHNCISECNVELCFVVSNEESVRGEWQGWCEEF